MSPSLLPLLPCGDPLKAPFATLVFPPPWVMTMRPWSSRRGGAKGQADSPTYHKLDVMRQPPAGGAADDGG